MPKTTYYTCSSFGQLLTSSGSWKDYNPWQFSSEYFDAELGLVYYNYRHYSPTLGRWTTRDPIEENGGVNLYATVGSNLTNCWDSLGLSQRSKTAKQLLEEFLAFLEENSTTEGTCWELEMEIEAGFEPYGTTETDRLISKLGKNILKRAYKPLGPFLDALEVGSYKIVAMYRGDNEHWGVTDQLTIEFECDCDGVFSISEEWEYIKVFDSTAFSNYEA